MKVTKRSIAEFAMIFLSMYVVYYIVTWLLMLGGSCTLSYFASYFGRKIAPIIILDGLIALWYFGKESRMAKLLNRGSQVTIIFAVEILIILFIGFSFNINFEVFSDLGNWSYIACFEYGLALIFTYLFLGRKTEFTFQTFALIATALFVAGTLYEIPVIYRMGEWSPIHIHQAFLLSPGIISIALFIGLLYYFKIHLTKIHYATLTVFLMYSVVIFFGSLNVNYPPFSFPYMPITNNIIQIHLTLTLLPRIPAMVFMLSLLFGITKLKYAEV